MRNIPIVLILLLSSTIVIAQKHSIYADVGYIPGISATYNYKVAKHFSAGAGVQGYMFPMPDDFENGFMPAVFADIRVNIMPAKKSQLFVFWDFGINLYNKEESYSRDSTNVFRSSNNNGFLVAMGFGYFRKMTKRGGGPYISLKLLSNWYMVWGYSILSEENYRSFASADIRPAICLGFKF